VKVVVEADGGARGNPGPAGFGAVVRDLDGAVLASRYGYLGVTTNNVAEYNGLIAGLTAASELGATEVEIRMDSKLIIEQMAGRWQIKNSGLRPLAAQAAALGSSFDAVSYVWIPRDQNREADALANKAMDSQSSSEPTAAPSWDVPVTKPTRLLLVRHGETAYTAEKRYSGRKDVPLSAVGEAQAAAVAQRIAGLALPVSAVVSSPLSRCVATAAAIADVLGLSVGVESDLIECDFGAWDGLTFDEVRTQYPRELDGWLRSTAMAPPGGESFQKVALRVRRSVQSLQQMHGESVVVVVSHVSPLKILLRDALAAGDAMLHRLYLDPAGLSIVDLWPDGGVAVRSVNETAHLADI
jgi:probable phosphoglycerate mutase